MQIIHSRDVPPLARSSALQSVFDSISEAQLREWVENIAFPRHFSAEPEQNRAAGAWLVEILNSFGFSVRTQGPWRNIVALPPIPFKKAILVGAHYDSIPGSPGADDNGSAVAAMLGCALACSRIQPRPAVIFAAFNREEDGFIGSADFVESFLPAAPFRITCAHILEMVGYASCLPLSQALPTALPIELSDTGDFLGLLADSRSAPAMDLVLRCCGAFTADLPATGLKIVPGAERLFPVLARSDHVPFWRRGIPAVMWTDTAEFRNPNYHRASDTPDTLAYPFLTRVTRLLTAALLCGCARPGAAAENPGDPPRT